MKKKYWFLIIGISFLLVMAIFRWFVAKEDFNTFVKPFNHWFPLLCYAWGCYFMGIYSGKK